MNELFFGVMIEDTVVRRWTQQGNTLVFHLEVSLLLDHPLYEPPQPDEWTCYKPAQLVFEHATSIAGLKDVQDARSTTDLDGSIDYGTLDSVIVDDPDQVRIYGDFGEVTICGATARLIIEP